MDPGLPVVPAIVATVITAPTIITAVVTTPTVIAAVITAPSSEGKPDGKAQAAPVIRTVIGIAAVIGVTVIRITPVRIIGIAVRVRGIIIWRATVVGVVGRWRGIWRHVDGLFRGDERGGRVFLGNRIRGRHSLLR
jgi:hypothetical protein